MATSQREEHIVQPSHWKQVVWHKGDSCKVYRLLLHNERSWWEWKNEGWHCLWCYDSLQTKVWEGLCFEISLVVAKTHNCFAAIFHGQVEGGRVWYPCSTCFASGSTSTTHVPPRSSVVRSPTKLPPSCAPSSAPAPAPTQQMQGSRFSTLNVEAMLMKMTIALSLTSKVNTEVSTKEAKPSPRERWHQVTIAFHCRLMWQTTLIWVETSINAKVILPYLVKISPDQFWTMMRKTTTSTPILASPNLYRSTQSACISCNVLEFMY